jgi:hypothetical protein
MENNLLLSKNGISIPSGYSSHSHGSHGPFIDGSLPIKNDDFPWLCEITRG